MYEKGYRTWASLWKSSLDLHLKDDFNKLMGPDLLLRRHPYFPSNLQVDLSFSNTATVQGKSRWITTHGPCDLPPFHDEVTIPVAASSPAPITFSSKSTPASRLLDSLAGQGNHVTVLFLAWSYILSARWAELIPAAYISNEEGCPNGSTTGYKDTSLPELCIVDVGDADESAVEWWKTVLGVNGGWTASIRTEKGAVLCSPWTVRAKGSSPFTVVGGPRLSRHSSSRSHPTFEMAMSYLISYCRYHNIDFQCRLALAAALFIPVAKYDNKKITLPVPGALLRGGRHSTEHHQPTPPFMDMKSRCLDKLLTLSCNARGVKSLLSSAFFEQDVDCNIYGAWLQGSLAFLDSEGPRDRLSLLNTLVGRDPGLAFLWAGAFITGAGVKCFQEARMGWWKVDLSAAAWTETLASFVQLPVDKPAPDVTQLSRADECRLMYLAHHPDHATPPLFPMRPFGFTSLEDTSLDVRLHASCGSAHGLEYQSFVWTCEEGEVVEQGLSDTSSSPSTRGKNGLSSDSADCGIAVDYSELDLEDDVSEMVTRNVFTWLRGEDGFPVAERAIREHEWIDNLESDDDGPIEGDTLSSFGVGNSGRWLLGVSTQRSNSF